MTGASRQECVLLVLLDRFERMRLPRTVEMKARVDRGERVTDSDLTLLREVLQDAREVKRCVDKVPELQPLYGRGLDLYEELLLKALENELRH